MTGRVLSMQRMPLKHGSIFWSGIKKENTLFSEKGKRMGKTGLEKMNNKTKK
jgi:hypothetical protein